MLSGSPFTFMGEVEEDLTITARESLNIFREKLCVSSSEAVELGPPWVLAFYSLPFSVLSSPLVSELPSLVVSALPSDIYWLAYSPSGIGLLLCPSKIVLSMEIIPTREPFPLITFQ